MITRRIQIAAIAVFLGISHAQGAQRWVDIDVDQDTRTAIDMESITQVGSFTQFWLRTFHYKTQAVPPYAWKPGAQTIPRFSYELDLMEIDCKARLIGTPSMQFLDLQDTIVGSSEMTDAQVSLHHIVPGTVAEHWLREVCNR